MHNTKSKHFSLLLIVLFIGLFTTCQDENTTPVSNMNNEFVFFNGNIYTVNSNQSWVEAI